MTGFGAADGSVGGGQLHLEVKTVNHRHFNPQLKLPHVLSEHEGAFRDLLRSRIDRGHVTVSARWVEEAPRASTIEIDPERAAEYQKAFDSLASHLGVDALVSLEHIARQPDVLINRAAELEPVPWEEVRDVLARAVDALDASRTAEGEVLGRELTARVEAIRAGLEEVKHHAPARVERERDRLRAAIRELTEGREVNEDRVAQEIAILADKLDVTEEIVRLETHLDAALTALGSGEPAGKTLGFLGQEMLREINTIGSKANDASIAQSVIGMKGELEKYREQVENIE